MKMKKIKFLSAFLILFIGTLFFNIEDVKAIGDGSGYAECHYEWGEQKSQDTASQQNYWYRKYEIAITFYKENNTYYSWAKIACTKDGDKQGTTVQENVCSIDNYNDIFHNADKYKKYFITESNWKCPNELYINKDNMNPKMSVYYDKSTCDEKNGGIVFWKKCSRTVPINYSDGYIIKPSGNPDPESVKLDATQEHSGTSYSNGNGSDNSSNSTDPSEMNPDELNQWAEDMKNKKDETEYENPCDVISKETKTEIQKWIVVIAVAGVIILIVITLLDFAKALVSSDENRMGKILKNFRIRIICVALLMLLPVIVTGIINLVNSASGNGVIGTNDPLCDINKK